MRPSFPQARGVLAAVGFALGLALLPSCETTLRLERGPADEDALRGFLEGHRAPGDWVMPPAALEFRVPDRPYRLEPSSGWGTTLGMPRVVSPHTYVVVDVGREVRNVLEQTTRRLFTPPRPPPSDAFTVRFQLSAATLGKSPFGSDSISCRLQGQARVLLPDGRELWSWPLRGEASGPLEVPRATREPSILYRASMAMAQELTDRLEAPEVQERIRSLVRIVRVCSQTGDPEEGLEKCVDHGLPFTEKVEIGR